MQTFVPCTSFERCAKVLDYRRLGKQRLECYDIIGLISNFERTQHSRKQQAYLIKRYSHHPAVLMWEGWEPALIQYFRAIVLEWVDRGYVNNYVPPHATRFTYPNWWGKSIHRSHRAALLYKDFHYYSRYWHIQPELNYFWPISSRTRRVK